MSGSNNISANKLVIESILEFHNECFLPGFKGVTLVVSHEFHFSPSPHFGLGFMGSDWGVK